MNEADQTQKGIVGVFNRAAATYDRIGPQFFAYFGEQLVERTQLFPQARVLDVATGRGAILFPAAQKVGPGGMVCGTDLAVEMVRETLMDIQSAGILHATVQQMDAERLEFTPACFDFVLCGFALWFFPQPFRALQEFFRVLVPGGRVGLTTWAEDCQYLHWCRRELAATLPSSATPSGNPATPRFDTPERLHEALHNVGFVDVQVFLEDQDFIYAREEEWWQSLWSHGMRALFEQLDERTLAQVKSAMLQKVKVFKQADGIHTRFQALCALATKPRVSCKNDGENDVQNTNPS